jgi:hypothetical protein
VQVGTAPTSLTAAAGIRTIVPGAAGGGYERAAPSTSWKARTLVGWTATDTTPDGSPGLYLEETATNEAFGMQLNQNASTQIVYTVDRPNGATSGVGQVIVLNSQPAGYPKDGLWMEAEYNAANVGSEVVFRWSIDGVNFVELGTYAVGSYFTSAPDKTVFTFDPTGDPASAVYTQFLYYETTL